MQLRLGGLFIAVAAIMAFSPVTDRVTNSYIFEAESQKFFKFIADPQNWKTINPTIIDLEVKESKLGSLLVTYTEHLVQLPWVTHSADSEYVICDHTKTIQSTHITCFLYKYFCITSKSESRVEKLKENMFTKYTEDIEYVCPRMFFLFCFNEVKSQRALIYESLVKITKTNPRLANGNIN